MKPLVYLAAPYSDPMAAIRLGRVEAINRAAGQLFAHGWHVFSPISHSHPIIEACDLRSDWESWRDYDLAMLSLCSAMVVYQLDGWTASQGVAAEVMHATVAGIPVHWWQPGSDAPEITVAP